MIRAARYAYAALAWAFLAGVVLQVFFIGLGLFAGSENLALHRDFGYILQLVPILVLVAAAVGRVGRPRLLWTLALVVVVIAFPILPVLRNDLPVAAALHPVGALLAFWLAIVVARGATQALGRTDAEAGSTGVPEPSA